MQLAGLDSADVVYGKLERRKSKIPDLHSNFNETPTSAASGPQRTGARRMRDKVINLVNLITYLSGCCSNEE